MPMDPKDIKRLAGDKLKKLRDKPEPDDDEKKGDEPGYGMPMGKPRGETTVSVTVCVPSHGKE